MPVLTEASLTNKGNSEYGYAGSRGFMGTDEGLNIKIQDELSIRRIWSLRLHQCIYVRLILVLIISSTTIIYM